MFLKKLALPASLMLLAAPVWADGGSDYAGERGDLIAEAKEDRQTEAVHPNGWGQRVSDRANGTMENPFGNLGGYLRANSEGPSGNK